MQNTYLIGLSRQVTLERQMDVIANNVANVNTNGFKADRSLFQEYLMPDAREDNFVAGSDRRLSHVMDRATFHDFAQGAAEPTKNPLDVAIDGGGFFVVQTPAGERYTRDGSFQINNQGQLVNAVGFSGARQRRPDPVPADRQADQHRRRRQRHRDRRHRPRRLGSRQAADGQVRGAASAQEGGSNLYSGGASQPDTVSQVRQGFVEKSNVNSVLEMSRLIEVTRTYTQISSLLQQQHDLHKSAIDKLADTPA